MCWPRRCLEHRSVRAPHLLCPELWTSEDETTLAARIARAVRDGPQREADIASTLAERTDRALGDAHLRAAYTSEEELRRTAREAAAHDPAIEDHLRARREESARRSIEWASATDAWASLRATRLAPRRILRWRDKRSGDASA